MGLSVQDFAAKIKAKYPEYRDVNDAELAQKVVAKYPEYKSKVDFGKSGSGAPNVAAAVSQGSEEIAKTISGQYQPPGSSNPLGAVGDFVNSVGKGATDLVGGMADYMVKPIVKGAAMVTLGGAKSTLDAAGAQLSGKSSQEIENARTQPLNIPGLGNINPTTSASNTIGSAADLGGAAINLATGGQGWLAQGAKAAIGSALQGGGKAAQEDDPNAGNIIGRAVTEGVTGGLTSAILTKVFGGLGKTTEQKLLQTTEDFKKSGLRSGLKENYVNALAGLDDEQKNVAMHYLDAGLEKLKNPIDAPDVFHVAGQDVEDFVSSANKMKKQLGKAVGDAKNTLADKTADVVPIVSTMKDAFSSANIKVNPGDFSLDFSKSDIKNAGEATKQIADIWDSIKGTIIEQNTPTGQPLLGQLQGQMNARDLEALTGQIDNITGLLKTSGYKSNNANNILSTLKGAINDQLGAVSPEFAKANEQFATFMQDYNKIKNATKVTLGNGQTATSGAQLLRRSLGNAADKPNEGIQAIANLAENFGLDAPTDLKTKAFLADLAEKYTGSGNPQSLSGGVEKATDAAINNSGKLGGIVGTLKDAKDFIAPSETIANNAKSLKKLIQSSIVKSSKGTTKLHIDPDTLQTIIQMASVLPKSALGSLFK